MVLVPGQDAQPPGIRGGTWWRRGGRTAGAAPLSRSSATYISWRTRLHSILGYRSSAEFENHHHYTISEKQSYHAVSRSAKAEQSKSPRWGSSMNDMRHSPRVGTEHQMRSEARGKRVVIIGAGVVGALAFEYFTYDSPHEVVAFSAEREFITTETFCGLPVVPFDKLAVEYPPIEYQAFVAVSANPTQLNRVRRRLYGAVKAIGYRCASYISSSAFVSPTAQIGENTIVAEGNSLHHMARVGNNVIMLSGIHVGHGA